jgi:hypothetical protein
VGGGPPPAAFLTVAAGVEAVAFFLLRLFAFGAVAFVACGWASAGGAAPYMLAMWFIC